MTANENGCFSIKHARAGNYNLYAWVPGFIGDYRYDAVVTISSGNIHSTLPLVKFIII